MEISLDEIRFYSNLVSSITPYVISLEDDGLLPFIEKERKYNRERKVYVSDDIAVKTKRRSMCKLIQEVCALIIARRILEHVVPPRVVGWYYDRGMSALAYVPIEEDINGTPLKRYGQWMGWRRADRYLYRRSLDEWYEMGFIHGDIVPRCMLKKKRLEGNFGLRRDHIFLGEKNGKPVIGVVDLENSMIVGERNAYSRLEVEAVERMLYGSNV